MNESWTAEEFRKYFFGEGTKMNESWTAEEFRKYFFQEMPDEKINLARDIPEIVKLLGEIKLLVEEGKKIHSDTVNADNTKKFTYEEIVKLLVEHSDNIDDYIDSMESVQKMELKKFLESVKTAKIQSEESLPRTNTDAVLKNMESIRKSNGHESSLKNNAKTPR
jgi:hypothetical protein